MVTIHVTLFPIVTSVLRPSREQIDDSQHGQYADEGHSPETQSAHNCCGQKQKPIQYGDFGWGNLGRLICLR